MSTFSLSLADFGKKSIEIADLVVRKVVLDIGTRIVERSPVGDATLWKSPPPKGYIGGRFRANWQYGNSEIGTPGTELPDIDPTGGVSVARIASGLPVQGAAKMLHILVNNLPYAQALEEGHSTQAPAGMVGLVVQEFSALVEDVVQETKP